MTICVVNHRRIYLPCNFLVAHSGITWDDFAWCFGRGWDCVEVVTSFLTFLSPPPFPSWPFDLWRTGTCLLSSAATLIAALLLDKDTSTSTASQTPRLTLPASETQSVPTWSVTWCGLPCCCASLLHALVSFPSHIISYISHIFMNGF